MNKSVRTFSSGWRRPVVRLRPSGAAAAARASKVIVFGAVMFLSVSALGQTSNEEFHSTDSFDCCPTQACQNERLRDLMQQRIDYARQCVAERAAPCHVEPELIRPPLCTAPKAPNLDGGITGGDVFGSYSSRPGGRTAAPPTGAKPPPRPAAPVNNTCVPVPDRQTQAQLRKTGIEVLDTMAAMGQQTDHALNAMGQAVLEELAYLAQPNATVWSQRSDRMKAAAEAVIEYLANDNAARSRQLRQAAEKAMESVQRDPAGYVGRTAAGILTGEATFVAGKVCRATAGKLQKAVSDSIKAQKAVQQLKAVVQAEKAIQAIFGESCGNQPFMAPSRLNPQGRRNSCVPSTWADELNEEIGAPVFNESHFRWDADDVGTSWDRIAAVQKQQWGDRQFAGHDAQRARLQAAGIPAIMPNGNGMRDIIEELEAAGDGAGGIVTIRRSDGSTHMLRSKNIGGRVMFRDPQTDSPGGYNFDPAFNNGPIVNSALYRTVGPDIVRQSPAVGGMSPR